MRELVMTSWPQRALLALVVISTGASGGVRPLDIPTEFVKSAETPALQLAAGSPPSLPRKAWPSLFAQPIKGPGAPGEMR